MPTTQISKTPEFLSKVKASFDNISSSLPKLAALVLVAALALGAVSGNDNDKSTSQYNLDNADFSGLDKSNTSANYASSSSQDNLSDKVKGYVSVRTNNPGNLMFQKNPINWDGMSMTQNKAVDYLETANGKYYKFQTPEFGIRALTRDITTKRGRGINTIEKIVPIYAPNAHGNDEDSYMKILEEYTGLGQSINISDEHMFDFIKGVIQKEGAGAGGYYTDEVIIRGMHMAYPDRYPAHLVKKSSMLVKSLAPIR